MSLLDFNALAQQCAPQVDPITLAAIVRTESGFNPYAIGVVNGQLARQPHSEAEAVATVRALETAGWNFSVGLAQVNRANWTRYGLGEKTAFDPCRNLAAGAAILQRCFDTARSMTRVAASTTGRPTQQALRASLSCYASGDFVTGYRTGYVQRVVANATARPIAAVPAIRTIETIESAVGTEAAAIQAASTGKSSAHEPRPAARGDEQGGPPGQNLHHDPPDDSAVVF